MSRMSASTHVTPQSICRLACMPQQIRRQVQPRHLESTACQLQAVATEPAAEVENMHSRRQVQKRHHAIDVGACLFADVNSSRYVS